MGRGEEGYGRAIFKFNVQATRSWENGVRYNNTMGAIVSYCTTPMMAIVPPRAHIHTYTYTHTHTHPEPAKVDS